LNEYLSDFQKEPSAIHLDKSTASLTYTVGKRNYELTISVKLPPTRTSHYLISYKISDPKLAWWKYDMLEHYYLNPNENFENFQTNVQKEFTVKKQDISETIHSITNLLFEKSDIIMENQLGASYKRMNK
ncbi:MAG TPA: hypothetical protein VKM36_10685, partial [Balneolaceae bacterium]|nr:hypothetical protein [Balneolaceae bacterium]